MNDDLAQKLIFKVPLLIHTRQSSIQASSLNCQTKLNKTDRQCNYNGNDSLTNNKTHHYCNIIIAL